MSEKSKKRGAQIVSSVMLIGTLVEAISILKISGALDWNWIWVLSPIWVLFSVFCIVMQLVFLFFMAQVGIDMFRKKS